MTKLKINPTNRGIHVSGEPRARDFFMYARWLICFEALALGILICFAEISGNLRYEGRIEGLDEAYDIESHMHYFIWRLRAREAFLLVMALWVAAILLAAYTRIRAGDRQVVIAKYGSWAAIVATLILPIAVLTVGFIFGLDVGM